MFDAMLFSDKIFEVANDRGKETEQRRPHPLKGMFYI